MSCLKRAFLSLRYHWKANAVLVLVLAAVASLTLTGLCTRRAAVQSCEKIRWELGGSVTLHSKAKNTDGTYRPVAYETAAAIAKLPHVSDFNFTSRAEAYAAGFRSHGQTDSDAQNIVLMGERSLSMVDDFKNKVCSSYCYGGRLLTKNDAGKPYAVVDFSLAKANSLSVGSTIQVSPNRSGTKKIALTIIGFYVDSDSSGAQGTSPLRIKDNIVYTPYETVGALTGSSSVYTADYIMDDPAQIDGLKARAAAMHLPDFGQSVLDAHDASYQAMAGSLQNLTGVTASLVKYLLIVGAAVLVVILLAMLLGWKYETGVLLSLGESKRNIVLQLGTEVLVPVLLAFALANLTGVLFAQKIGDLLYAAQSSVIDESMGAVAPLLIVRVTGSDLAFLYLSGIVLAALAVAVLAWSVFRYHPKEILTQTNE